MSRRGHSCTQYTVLDDTVVKEHNAAAPADMGNGMQSGSIPIPLHLPLLARNRATKIKDGPYTLEATLKTMIPNLIKQHKIPALNISNSKHNKTQITRNRTP